MASYLFFLIATLSILMLSASADVFVSIDCGSTDTYTDDNLIVWTGDEGNYMTNGRSQVVPSANSISPVLDTLRVFATRKKNCYSITEASKGDRVLVRASFYYGNYDGKSSPPTFDLQFDGNHWMTVEALSTGYVYYEVIYVLKLDYVSVCVAQTNPGQFPFISALEVRSLDSTMYSHIDQSYPLHLINRVAHGANQTIRYIEDPYDRIWAPVLARGGGLTNVVSDALPIDTSSSLDRPPPAVLKNAVTAVTPAAPIRFMTTGSDEIPMYLTIYFSEVTQLEATQNRSFQVFMNNEALLDQPIVPPYGSFREMYAGNLTVPPNSNFTLEPTKESNMPPLINAAEAFLIGDVLTDGTNSKDVEGLTSLQKAFDVLRDWGGDPCLPSPYSWDWVNCSSDPIPRVTALYLSSSDLSGALPDFSSMDALQTIDFHNNSLNGPIPEFLAKLPSLKQLNLGSNQFSGPIPDSLSKKNGLNLVVTGNPDLCASGKSCKTTSTSSDSNNPGLSSRNKKSSKLPVILGTTIPIFIIIWAVVGVFIILHNRRKTSAVAAVSNSGQTGANRPQLSGTKHQMMGKLGQAILHEIKVNMENQDNNVELTDQSNNQQPNSSTFSS